MGLGGLEMGRGRVLYYSDVVLGIICITLMNYLLELLPGWHNWSRAFERSWGGATALLILWCVLRSSKRV